MSDFNLQQYSANFSTYLETDPLGTRGGLTPDARVELLEKYLPRGRRVFEIGSGGGNDAKSLKEHGYNVLASDFVPEFLNILRDKDIDVITFDATKDEFPEDCDALYANAVFVHLSPEELKTLLRSAYSKLQNEKVLFISTLKGVGSERSSRTSGFERDFYYYEIPFLTNILNEAGFTVEYSKHVESKWIQLIATSK